VQEEIDQRSCGRKYVGVSPATQQVREQVRAAVEAACDTILITGETGTGKEVVAREIHFQAETAASPFIAVSCPALPDTLVESELFGHAKGAFTGATTDRAGYFEMADGGTLFLDEVGELSASAQAVLLRVLETRTFRRVGGTKEASVSVRVVAATNADLDRAVALGEFRRDLLHRLDVFPIHLLPLRERREDIVPLAEHFLAAYGLTRGLRYRGFSLEAIGVLTSYDYPGNARELRNIVDRAAILGRGAELIQAEHFPLSGIERRGNSPPTAKPQTEEARERILAALQECRWNRRKAAQRLGMPYSTLRYRIEKLGIGKD
jgi:transcriptional regulator with GAF, ATPase, and Fis domain